MISNLTSGLLQMLFSLFIHNSDFFILFLFFLFSLWFLILFFLKASTIFLKFPALTSIFVALLALIVVTFCSYSPRRCWLYWNSSNTFDAIIGTIILIFLIVEIIIILAADSLLFRQRYDWELIQRRIPLMVMMMSLSNKLMTRSR